MVYVGICARLNGKSNEQGDILSDNVSIPNGPIPVTHEFSEKVRLGHAYVERIENDIIAYVHLIDHPYLAPELIEKMTAVVGGAILKREGSTILNWSIKSIGITSFPADKTLPTLKIAVRNNCCFYNGPPFTQCKKCGGRQSDL